MYHKAEPGIWLPEAGIAQAARILAADLTRAAIELGEVYGWLHKVNEQEAHRLIEALDIIEPILDACQELIDRQGSEIS